VSSSPLGGYIKTYRATRQHPVWDLTPSQYKVWSTILLMVNFQNGEWWNGSERIPIPPGTMITSEHHLAKEAGRGITRKVVQRAIQNLIRLESISVKSRDKRYTEINVINWPIYQSNGDTEVQEEVQGRDKDGTRTGHNVRREEGKKKQQTPDGFARFWETYPRRDAKLAAERAWKKLDPDATLQEQILTALSEQIKRDYGKRERDKIPHPATWLNGRYWENEIGRGNGNTTPKDDAWPITCKCKCGEFHETPRASPRICPKALSIRTERELPLG
jgi:hypothetical protein